MIWLIGESIKISAELKYELSDSGIDYKEFQKIAEAYKQLQTEVPSVIIVDSDLSEITCLEFCAHLKSSGVFRRPYLIILSDNDSESLELSMFDAGADEFLLRPFRPKALVRQIVRKLKEVNTLYTNKRDLKIDRESFSVYLDRCLIPLSRKEFELLHLIASHPGKVFTREEIFTRIWKRSHDAKERTIDVHILRLRKKLGEDFITTQKGIGYRFCA